jgi:general stress protein 26
MSKNNLFNEEAKAKIKELAENIDFAMMETHLGAKPTHIIPMGTKDVDEEGCIWFLSNKNSEHNGYIDADNSIQLIYSKPGDMEFMTIFGNAFVSTDRQILEKYYGQPDDTWFDGVDDPNLTAIKVVPQDAHYWDTKNGKFVSLLKMGVGAVTGKKQDLGEEGELQM